MIDGVHVTQLRRFPDERGVIMHMMRRDDPLFREFGEVYFSAVHPGVVKAWHLHKTQIDWWYVPIGVLKVALYDARPESPTTGVLQELFMGGEHGYSVLKIPAGVAHGCKAIGGTAHLLYVTSNVYDTSEEGRIPFDDAEIGYDWISGPTIK